MQDGPSEMLASGPWAGGQGSPADWSLAFERRRSQEGDEAQSICVLRLRAASQAPNNLKMK
ncbi:hypothetical protein E4U41_003078 [Claviceps citrina]|nr:hypothetical protein E4U41_003078 [Claviceps citrina]